MAASLSLSATPASSPLLCAHHPLYRFIFLIGVGFIFFLRHTTRKTMLYKDCVSIRRRKVLQILRNLLFDLVEIKLLMFMLLMIQKKRRS
ncbi:hypothetical protein ACHQM5_011389 [Ranunculus cassubicifolius]